jgi:hypothetical protein
MSFNQLDKVVIIEIGKYLTLYNDYVSLLLTCKKVAHIFTLLTSKQSQDLNIRLNYGVWTGDSFTSTVFLHIFRNVMQSPTIESSSAVLYWRGKYSKGWYDRRGNSQRIDITYSVTFVKDNIAGIDEPYIYLYNPLEIENFLPGIDSLKFKVNNGMVTFPDVTSLHSFFNELKSISRHRQEVTRRWDYSNEVEIKLE